MAAERREAGFTIIEVMAALVILAIALTAVFSTFTSQQASYQNQSRIAEMQQNLRLASDMLARDIRMAGYGLPLNEATDNVSVPNTVLPGGVNGMRAIFPVDNTTGPDRIYLLYRIDLEPQVLMSTMTLSPLAVVLDNTASGFTHDFTAGGGDLVIVADDETADLFQSTSVTAAAGPQLNFGAGPVYNAGHTKTYLIDPMSGTPKVYVSKARFALYYIDDTSDPSHPTLMVDRLIPGQAPQPVADDIEDMQLAYLVDTDGDIEKDVEQTLLGAVGDITAPQIPQIRQVRLTLVARSRVPEPGWTGRRPAAGNRAGATVDDGYRRRTLEMVIDVRNSGL